MQRNSAGQFVKLRYNKKRIEARFWSKVEKTNGCWNWLGFIAKNGYAKFWVFHKEKQLAHRFVYELTKGPIPKDKEIDHLCFNRSCVNPEHMQIVTHRENMLRGNTVAAKNLAKTHCINGHFLSAENIDRKFFQKTGIRQCLTCRQIWTRKRYLRKKETSEFHEL